jgi:hypothetical protein
MIEVDGEFRADARFDEFLTFNEAKLDAVVSLLAPVLDGQRLRGRKTTKTEAEAFRRTVGVVVANAIICEKDGVYYSRRYETYSGTSPYRPYWLGSKRLLRVINSLTSAGLLRADTGRWAGYFVKGVRSTFIGTLELVEKLKSIQVEANATQRERWNAPALVLKGKDGNLIRYDPSDQLIARQTAELRAYNTFTAAQSISCPDWKGKSRLTDLTRTYNEGSWELGGRHFGGFWQQIPSDLRQNLLINGQKTVELDYGGFNTRVLYHQVGQTIEGDPFDIPEIRNLFDKLGIDWKTKGRKAVKLMVNIAIGAKSINALYTDKALTKIKLEKDIVRQCIQIIIKHHHPIKNLLFKGKSLELMNLESNICHDIIISGMDNGIVILPVFDSFITTKDNIDYLKSEMGKNYYIKVGYTPVIN